MKSIFVFVGSIALGMSLSQAIGNNARVEAFGFLSSLPASYTVTANGAPVSHPSTLVAALHSAASVLGHHSHPTKTIHVRVEANGQAITFNLGRDSQNPQEYWVFYPKYRVSSMNEIGRITTDALDGY
jgi:hypothetical protein